MDFLQQYNLTEKSYFREQLPSVYKNLQVVGYLELGKYSEANEQINELIKTDMNGNHWTDGKIFQSIVRIYCFI